MRQKQKTEVKTRKRQLTNEAWNKAFVITSVCRADLRGFFSDEEIAELDDDDMRYIARKMADAYLDQVYWIDLEIIAGHALEEK